MFICSFFCYLFVPVFVILFFFVFCFFVVSFSQIVAILLYSLPWARYWRFSIFSIHWTPSHRIFFFSPIPQHFFPQTCYSFQLSNCDCPYHSYAYASVHCFEHTGMLFCITLTYWNAFFLHFFDHTGMLFLHCFQRSDLRHYHPSFSFFSIKYAALLFAFCFLLRIVFPLRAFLFCSHYQNKTSRIDILSSLYDSLTSYLSFLLCTVSFIGLFTTELPPTYHHFFKIIKLIIFIHHCGSLY